MDIKSYLKEKAPEIDKLIENTIPRKFDKESLEYMAGQANYKYDLETLTKSISEPIWDFLDRGGKRWRPTLMLLMIRVFGGNLKKYKKFAAIPEIVHNGCVTEDTFVLDKDGLPRKVTKFEKGEKVLSLDEQGNVVKEKIIKKHNNGQKNVFRVKTNNREITLTKNHPILTISKKQPLRMGLTDFGENKIRNKLSQMKTNISRFCENIYPSLKDRVNFSLKHMKNVLYGYPNLLLPTPTVENISKQLELNKEKCWEEKQCKYQKAEINLQWKRVKNLNEGDLIVVSKEVPVDNSKLPKIPEVSQSSKDKNNIPKKFTIEMAQLCGFLLGDGYIDVKGRTVLCTPKTNPERKAYKQLVETIFKNTPSTSKNSITICSKAVASIFKNLGFAKKSTEKEIPDWVFKLPKKHKLAFIKGYLDADGSVSKRGVVRFECANKKIIKKLKMLLDNLGLVTGNLRQRKINNEHFKRKAKKETTLYSISLYSRNKVLKLIGSEIEEHRKRLKKSSQRQVSFRFERSIPNMPGDMSIKEFGFNKVTGIEEVGKKRTFDLQIKNTHNYISNGIVTHNTIIVDDLEDDSDLRRGKPAMHKLFGKDVAINTGNSLYFIPSAIIKKSDLNPEKKNQLYELYMQEMVNVSIGQALDIQWHKDEKIPSEKEYLQMCAFKTGCLARMAAKMGAILAGAPKEKIEKVGQWAESVGIGFQIQDDILNIAPSKEWGKDTGDDINEGKKTLLVIKALEKLNEEDSKRLKEILAKHTEDQQEIKEAIELIKKTNAISYCKNLAQKMVQNAWQKLEPELNKGKAKDTIKDFNDFLVERDI